jgi:hypothetical protein
MVVWRMNGGAIPKVPFGSTREQKSMPPKIVDTGRNVVSTCRALEVPVHDPVAEVPSEHDRLGIDPAERLRAAGCSEGLADGVIGIRKVPHPVG